MRPLWSYGVFDNSPIETALTVGGLRRALSPTFPAGEMVVFFIPWRVVAEESGAAQ